MSTSSVNQTQSIANSTCQICWCAAGEAERSGGTFCLPGNNNNNNKIINNNNNNNCARAGDGAARRHSREHAAVADVEYVPAGHTAHARLCDRRKQTPN